VPRVREVEGACTDPVHRGLSRRLPHDTGLGTGDRLGRGRVLLKPLRAREGARRRGAQRSEINKQSPRGERDYNSEKFFC
jgi:hypothetical protein